MRSTVQSDAVEWRGPPCLRCTHAMCVAGVAAAVATGGKEPKSLLPRIKKMLGHSLYLYGTSLFSAARRQMPAIFQSIAPLKKGVEGTERRIKKERVCRRASCENAVCDKVLGLLVKTGLVRAEDWTETGHGAQSPACSMFPPRARHQTENRDKDKDESRHKW